MALTVNKIASSGVFCPLYWSPLNTSFTVLECCLRKFQCSMGGKGDTLSVESGHFVKTQFLSTAGCGFDVRLTHGSQMLFFSSVDWDVRFPWFSCVSCVVWTSKGSGRGGKCVGLR